MFLKAKKPVQATEQTGYPSRQFDDSVREGDSNSPMSTRPMETWRSVAHMTEVTDRVSTLTSADTPEAMIHAIDIALKRIFEVKNTVNDDTEKVAQSVLPALTPFQELLSNVRDVVLAEYQRSILPLEFEQWGQHAIDDLEQSISAHESLLTQLEAMPCESIAQAWKIFEFWNKHHLNRWFDDLVHSHFYYPHLAGVQRFAEDRRHRIVNMQKFIDGKKKLLAQVRALQPKEELIHTTL
jgi:hypothetical protein